MIRGVLVSIGVGLVAGAAVRFVVRRWLRRGSLERRRLEGLGVVASHREEWPRDGY